MAWVPTSENEYTIGVRPMRQFGVTTSSTEVTHLTIAALVLAVDLAIIIANPIGGGSSLVGKLGGSLGVFAVALAIALSAFVAHEMAHKVVAQRYGFWAEFRMSPFGLLISFMTALFGFLFAAPGATVIGGMGNAREWGRTSLAGPGLNFVLGLAFFGGFGLVHALKLPVGLGAALLLLAFYNGWWAAFNLIPIGPLDGRKVWRWSHRVWTAAFLLALAFAAVAFVVLNTVL
jgi:Zn-dependent protease